MNQGGEWELRGELSIVIAIFYSKKIRFSPFSPFLHGKNGGNFLAIFAIFEFSCFRVVFQKSLGIGSFKKSLGPGHYAIYAGSY